MRYALDVGELGYEPGEKVAAFGTFNLVGNEFRDWQVQLIALAARGRRMRDPVEHIVISWSEDEKRSETQAREAVALLLEVCGYGRCPALWALHTNTRHGNAHIMVVRIDPATGVAQGDDWDIGRLHQALALIEERQVRAPEPNAIYEARDGAVYDRASARMVRSADGEQVAHRKHGRVLPAEIAAVADGLRSSMDGARTWEHLHLSLARLDAMYDQKGSGPVIRRGRGECKASELGRAYGRGELEKRLGAFQPRAAAREYLAYQEACRARLAEARRCRDDEKTRLNAWLTATPAQVGSQNPLLTAAIQAEYAAALQSLTAAFALAIDGFAKTRLSEQAWQGAGRPPTAPSLNLPLLVVPGGDAYRESQANVPASFTRGTRGSRASYFALDGGHAFDDARLFIIVYRSDSETIDAALQLAATRWGAVRILGSEAFQDACLARASILGIDAVDERGRRSRQARTRGMPASESEIEAAEEPGLTPQERGAPLDLAVQSKWLPDGGKVR
jgi:hypothetical protein